MPEGRLLRRSVSLSQQLADLASDTARFLHSWTVCWVDRDGLITAEPPQFRARVCPLIGHVTDEVCARVLCDWVVTKLAYAYVDERAQRVIWLCGFRRQQSRSWRYSKEAPSAFGPPPDKRIRALFDKGPNLTSLEQLQTLSGIAPEWLSQLAGLTPKQPELPGIGVTVTTRSGPGPDLVPNQLETNGMEGNGKEGKQTAQARTPARTRAHAREEPGAGAPEEHPPEHSPEAAQVLVELREHPALARVATIEMAEQALTNLATAGGGVADTAMLKNQIRAMATRAGTYESKGEPWSDKTMLDMFSFYTSGVGRPRHLQRSAVPQHGDSADRQREAREDWAEDEERKRLDEEAEEVGF